MVRSTEGQREGVLMRWGLIPFFAKGVPPKYSTINARLETVETSPAYRGPWKRGQRCIQPVTGFYEWHLSEDGTKNPFYIHLADQTTVVPDLRARVLSAVQRLDEALMVDPDRGRETLRGILGDKIKLQPDESGKYLWADYELGLVPFVRECGNYGSGGRI